MKYSKTDSMLQGLFSGKYKYTNKKKKVNVKQMYKVTDMRVSQRRTTDLHTS